MISSISSASPCAFQVHHRVRNLRGSEFKAYLDTQEDGENETLSKKIHSTFAHGRGLC